MRTLRVLVRTWQLQCCGGPIQVGDDVRWEARLRVRRDDLSPALAALDPPIEAIEDHHENEDADGCVFGRVEAIAVVGGPRRLEPHDVVTGREAVDGFEPAGYVIDVTPWPA